MSNGMTPNNGIVQKQADSMPYFTSILPWQEFRWHQLVARYDRLPHGLLFAGMQGIGKRAFVWRYTAWLLCRRRLDSEQGACGECQSCLWLKSGTHPDLLVLPMSSLPLAVDDDSLQSASKKGKFSSSNNTKVKTKADKKDKVKVDDIRAIQPFLTQGSIGKRICIIDNADLMTIAASNALLKTLEEPRSNVHLFLVTDKPSKLLPTIKSRVQQIPINKMTVESVKQYLIDNIDLTVLQGDNTAGDTVGGQGTVQQLNEGLIDQHITQALALSNGAPLAALNMLKAQWYTERSTWITTWLALRAGKRSSLAASDYWQKLLPLSEFLTLCEVMLLDLSRSCMGLGVHQLDLNLDQYNQTLTDLKIENVNNMLFAIDDMKQDLQQNVQDKLGYDRLFSLLSTL